MEKRVGEIAFGVISLILLASLLGLSSCINWGGFFVCETPPAPPISVDLSFPNGAPRLNQTAELRCVVKTPALTADNVTVKINLPDGIELVSGTLSVQFGTMPEGDVKEVKAIIKPVKVGNYTIEVKRSLVSRDPSFRPGPGLFNIYLSVSESSAEWGEYPPWIGKPGPPLPLPKDLPPPPATWPQRN